MIKFENNKVLFKIQGHKIHLIYTHLPPETLLTITQLADNSKVNPSNVSNNDTES